MSTKLDCSWMHKYKFEIILIILLCIALYYIFNNPNNSKKEEFFSNKDPYEYARGKYVHMDKKDESQSEKSDINTLGSECAGKDCTFVASDLLPKVTEKDRDLTPDLKGLHLLDTTDYIGLDTISNTLRNANVSLRAEPPNPKTVVSPWLNSTIEPDPYRKGLVDKCD